MREHKKELYIEEKAKNIECIRQLKMLGGFLNKRLSYNSSVNQTVAIVQSDINKLQDYAKVLSRKRKTMIAN